MRGLEIKVKTLGCGINAAEDMRRLPLTIANVGIKSKAFGIIVPAGLDIGVAYFAVIIRYAVDVQIRSVELRDTG